MAHRTSPETDSGPQSFVQSLYERNLLFFQNNFSDLYKSIQKLQLKNTEVRINTALGEVDLIDAGNSCYGGKGIEFAVNEVNDWEKAYPTGLSIRTLRPPFKGDYNRPRFFSKKIDTLIEKSPITKKNFQWYTHNNPAHMVVFMGIGLGLHIQEYLERNDVRNIILFENNPEHFLASMYVVDWETIFSPYLGDTSRTLRLILREFEDERDITACIWNELICYCPHFPASCLFYNHRRSSVYGNTVRKLQQDVHVYMNLWGYYDDEINQLNNGFFNFRNGVPKTPCYTDFKLELPVVIVGSGPSLDERIEDLKALKDKAIIISCGTALRSLYSYGIKPNIHVEIESHQLTYDLLKKMDQDWLNDIGLIGAAQINPRNFKLFKRKMAFIKDSATMAALFCSPKEIIKGTTPTCTNTGLAIALYYQAKTIFMIGTDFGFSDPDFHHTKSSVYYDKDADPLIKESVSQQNSSLIKDVSVTGEEIYTKPTYYTSKRRAEVEITRAINTFKDINIYNISNGAKISGAKWLNTELSQTMISKLPLSNPDAVINELFDKNENIVSQEMLDQGIDKVLTLFEELKEKIPNIIKRHNKSKDIASAITTELNHYLEQHVKINFPYLYYMVRGSLWHYMYSLYTHVWAMEKVTPESVNHFVNEWINSMNELLTEWPKHVQGVLSKKRTIDDIRLNTPMEQAIPSEE